jgi:hypothetical protein
MNAELFNTALLEKMYVCRELIFLNSTSLPHIGTLRCTLSAVLIFVRGKSYVPTYGTLPLILG